MGEKKLSKNFILHGGILAAAGILVRIIGMLYRIPMVNIIGSEGNGIYSVAFNIYNIVLVLSSYGLPMAVSKLVSARYSNKRYKDSHKVFVSSVIVSVTTGGIAALLVFFGADFLESYVYQYPGIALPLRVLAPTIFIVAVMGVFRGFYQGQGTMIPTAVSQLLEQVVNAFVSVFAAYMLVKTYSDSAKAGAFGAAGGTLGTAMGAFTALLFLAFVYIIYRPVFRKKIARDTNSIDETYGSIFKLIVITMIPIILSQTFYQISATIDDIMFSKIMTGIGVDAATISRDIGNYNSSYMILISLPMGVASAMSSSMMPSIVASKTKGFYNEIRDKIAATVKANMIIVLPSFIGFLVLGKPVIQLMFPSYNSSQGATMLKIGAIAVIFYTISTVTSAALQGMDKMNIPVVHACISLIIHIILVWVLLVTTKLGIYAIVIGSATFPILIFILNLRALNKYIGYRQEVMITFGIPFVCALIMGVVTGGVYNLFITILSSNLVAVAFALIAAFISYFAPLYLFKKKGIY